MDWKTSMKIKIILTCILALTLTGLIPSALGAKDEFKVSKYGAGYQIWFEAENYTSRTPDTDVHWKVEEIKNAYEKTVLGPTGNFGGMLRYEFDIRICGPEAKGGEWYFWARLVNPKNQSDFMLAEGHPTLWGTVKLIH